MAGKQVNFDLNVDASDGIRGLKDFSNAAKKAGKDAAKGLEDTADAGDKARAAIKAMAEAFDAELRDAAKAADDLAQALGPELTAKTDIDQVVKDLHAMGVEFVDISAQSDKFAASLKEVDDIRLKQLADGVDATSRSLKTADANADQLASTLRGVDSDQRIGRVATDTDRVTASSVKARNAQANLWGNAAQDLGQFLGISGSAGVAIGQLAEGAADAANDGEKLGSVLGGIGKQVGPMLAITAATVGIGLALKALSGNQKEIAENTQQATEAFEDSIGTLEAWKSAIDEAFSSGVASDAEAFSKQIAGALETALSPEQFDQLRVAMSNLGLTFEDIGGLAETNSQNLGAQAEASLKAAGATDEMITRLKELIAETGNAGDAVIELQNEMSFTDINNQPLIDFINDNKVLVDALDEVGEGFDQLNIDQAAQKFLQLERSVDPATRAMVNQALATTKNTDGTINYIEALREYISLQQEATRENKATVDAAVAYGDALRANADRMAEYVDGMEPATEATVDFNKIQEDFVDDTNAAVEATQERVRALFDLRDAVREAAAGFATAAGRVDTFGAATDVFREFGALDSAQQLGDIADGFTALATAYDEAGSAAEGADLIPESFNEVFGMDEDLKPVIEAVQQLAGAVDTQLAEAFEFGGESGLRKAAKEIEDHLRPQLAAAGLDAQQIDEVLGAIGVREIDIDARVALTIEENARQLLDAALSGSDLPLDVKLNLLALGETDPLAALRGLIAALPPTQVPVELVALLDQWEADVAGVTTPDTPYTADVAVESNAGEVSDDIDDAAEDRDTEIKADLKQQVIAGMLLGLYLDYVARPRTAPITVEGKNMAVTELLFNLIARDRSADFFAIPHAHEYVESLLNNIARDRTADIFVVPHTAGGGGGATTQTLGVGTLAAPAPALTAGPTAAPTVTATTSSVSSVTQTPFVAAASGPINVTINAGVLGNHFDVERTVARALRRHQRVNGRR